MREEETFYNPVTPHFDDEQTLLAARPVVPLKQINTKLKYKRRWFLGGAFAVAMLLGAASAVLSAYLKLRQAPEPEITSSAVVEESVPVEVPTPAVEEQHPVITPVSITPKHTAPRPRNTDHKDRVVRTPQLSEEEDLERIRQAVLVEQWQERRMRRVARRERRRAQHNDRDLSNIDEIFEGRRKP